MVEPGQNRRNAQVFLVDPELDAAKGISNNLYIPNGYSAQEQENFKELVCVVRNALKKTNPYVRDCVTMCEMDAVESSGIVHQYFIDADKRPEGEHVRRYNGDKHLEEVSVYIPNQHFQTSEGFHDVVIKKRSGVEPTVVVSDQNRAFDTLNFPLLFPAGRDGWHSTLKDSKNKPVSPMAVTKFMLFERGDEPNLLLRSGRLLQEYLVVHYG